MSQTTTSVEAPTPLDGRLLTRIFYVFVLLALVSAGLSVVGKWAGRSIAMAGHTDDRTLREIVIGNDVFLVPANAIRAERARVDGVAQRLDLYLRWPDMQGYTVETRDDFNNAAGEARLLFVSIEPKSMSRDMSGRYEPIYRALIEPKGTPAAGGVAMHAFTEKSGYENEVLAVAQRPGAEPFVARCLTGPAAAASLAPCQRDVALGNDLSLSYRFPVAFLGEWKALDDAIVGWTRARLRTVANAR